MQVPRGRQSVSAEALQNPPLGADPGGAHTAAAADGEWQETVREDLGVRDAAGLAVGQRVSLTNGGARRHPETHRRRGETVPFSCITATRGVFPMQSSI